MTAWAMLATGTAAMLAMMFGVWLLHVRIRNASIVDVAWSAGIGILAVLYAAVGTGDPARRTIAAAMGGVWSARLALYLARRVAGAPEDARYQALRERWGGNTVLKFLWFFLFQGILDVVLAVPFLLVSLNAVPGLGGFEIAGIGLWLVAVTGEAVADAQLKRFKADPANRGGICDRGLWRYSRHPNYFFEWLVWCAVALFALGTPWGWVSIACPAMMLHFLLRVTGIPMTEEHMLRTRGDAFRAYQRRTSAFVPLPPRGV